MTSASAPVRCTAPMRRPAPNIDSDHAQPYMAPARRDGPRTPTPERMPATAETTMPAMSTVPKTIHAGVVGMRNQGLPPLSAALQMAPNPTIHAAAQVMSITA